MQVTWPLLVRWIKRSEEHHVSITWTRGPPDLINARGLNAGVITVMIQSGGEHRDRRIAIQWRQIDVFYNALH